MSLENSKKRFSQLDKLLSTPGPFVGNGFDASLGIDSLSDMKILVVGAGGLGCELLKDLAMMGFVDIHVIDCDTIDLSNLNRQFLFRTKDVGRSKAIVAAEFINNRVPGCRVVGHESRIEDKPSSFYTQFNVIVCGLDAIEPRMWLNQMVFGLLQPLADGSCEQIIPVVDGGTEGFKGNARVIIPSLDYACMDCTRDLYPPRVTFPLCTLTNRPRLPEHCIEYTKLVLWSEQNPFGNVPLDGDDPVHLQWVYDKSMDRAQEFGIEGVTYRLTQGVVKHIIPAVASTNSVIASACITEVFKLLTDCAPLMNNYFVFNDSSGIYSYTYKAERKPNCTVCSHLPIVLKVSHQITLNDLIEQIKDDYGIASQSVMHNSQALYMKCLHEQLSSNLVKTLQQLNIETGHNIIVQDSKNNRIFSMSFVD